MAIIKPGVTMREPRTKEELKSFISQEWNSAQIGIIKNLCSWFIEKVKKVLELGGSRLEPEHLKKKQKIEEINKWKKPESLPLFRFVYNDKVIFLPKKRNRIIKKGKKNS